MTLAAVAKCLQAVTWLVARGNKKVRTIILFYRLLLFPLFFSKNNYAIQKYIYSIIIIFIKILFSLIIIFMFIVIIIFFVVFFHHPRHLHLRHHYLHLRRYLQLLPQPCELPPRPFLQPPPCAAHSDGIFFSW